MDDGYSYIKILKNGTPYWWDKQTFESRIWSKRILQVYDTKLWSCPYFLKTKIPNIKEQDRHFLGLESYPSNTYVTFRYNALFDNMKYLREIESICKKLPNPIKFSFTVPPTLKDCIRINYDNAMSKNPIKIDIQNLPSKSEVEHNNPNPIRIKRIRVL